MAFTVDANAHITTQELANRDATYMLVRFKAGKFQAALTAGKATSSGGLHAEEHFDAWCRNAANRGTIQAWITSGGPIMELFLTKTPCGRDDHYCAKKLIKLAQFLNGSEYGLNHMYILALGAHKGTGNASTQRALTKIMGAQPLIELYVWDPGADPFDQTDQNLRANILHFDNSENPRRGTDVSTRLLTLTEYMHTGLGYHTTTQADDASQESDMEQ